MDCSLKLSVIIPVYNVENYIERCARSLMEQTMEEGIEFLFINDCSRDDSIRKLERVFNEYPQRISQVQILNMECNSGQAAVHSFGVEHAKGEYVIRCDSDDYVEREMYQTLVDEAFKTDADMVNCGMYYHYHDSIKKNIGTSFNDSGKTILRNLWKVSGPYFCLWNKLIRRSLLVDNGLYPYPNINIGEDLGLVYRVLYYCEKVVSVPFALYHYDCTRATSISHEDVLRRWNDVKIVLSNLSFFFEEKQDAKDFRLSMYAVQFEQKTDYLLPNRYYEKWRMEFPDCNSYIFRYQFLPFRTRLLYYLALSKHSIFRKVALYRLSL